MSTIGPGRFFPVQIFDLSPVGTIAGLNATSLPFSSQGQLGQIIEDSGNLYRLVQRVNTTADVTTSAGFVGHFVDDTRQIVSSDYDDAAYGINSVAGAFLGAVTNNNYCFIQIGGVQSGCLVAASTAAGDNMIGSSTDGTFGRVAVGAATVQSVVFAIALTAVSGGKSDVRWLAGNLL